MRLLIANRGEVAVRIARGAAELGSPTVAVYSEDDAGARHIGAADEARPLGGAGPAAYLDADRLLAVARDTDCAALHPGYGFLSESAAFARRCAEAGVVFVGPTPGTLDLFGDKARARVLARSTGVPLLAGTDGPTSLEEARALLVELGEGAALMVKAVAGGGGRGMRAVRRPEDLEDAWTRCRSEAERAFGRSDVYVEQLLPRARHVEVQVVGDGRGGLVALGERECSLQRRHQKLVEIAPAPALDDEDRERLTDAALRLADAAGLASLCTFEFLVGAGQGDGDGRPLAFMEANPRLQVEHTVTEEVTGVDLVQTQLRLAAGASLADLGLVEAPAVRGTALQARVCLETLGPDGVARPAAGTMTTFAIPSGPGVRVDTAGHAGGHANPRFDSLVAKVVVHAPSGRLEDAIGRADRALAEFEIDGVATNIAFLRNLLGRPEVLTGDVDTEYVDRHLAELLPRETTATAAPADNDNDNAAADAGIDGPAPDGAVTIPAPMQGTVVGVEAGPGEKVAAGQPLLVLEAMKMEHVLTAPVGGVLQRVLVEVGETVLEGRPLLYLQPVEGDVAEERLDEEVDLDRVRPDLAEVLARHEIARDDVRRDAVARRRRTGQRTARENVADLCDPGTFVEYGPLVVAAQRNRRSIEELIERTPADGMVAGVGSVNGDLFGTGTARCAVLSYDWTVLAGTQGLQNHRKKDRLFNLVERHRLPVVFFTEGGGGRPGDDSIGAMGLDCTTFEVFGRLSGLVPLVGVTSGRCFAGNAALLGCCDVVIATEGSNIGMGGPTMVEGGGLGVFRPEEIGPLDVQVRNGVVDVAVADEAEAVEVARRYLSYFQGRVAAWDCEDQRRLRSLVPENRLRVYDIRTVVDTLADTGSVLELRRHFGAGMITALIRVEGRPLGVVANNPGHLAGAIDSAAADKAARFMQLCDAFDVPILFLCDTPGIMVGPEAEKTGTVRHASRMFVTGANLTVPSFAIVVRKAYGLGALAMAGGSFRAPSFMVAWPTGEFGGMGLEGAVKLGYRDELAAIAEPEERQRYFDAKVAKMYEEGKALSIATHFEIDDVIDPADSRRWITAALDTAEAAGSGPRVGKKRPCVDTW